MATREIIYEIPSAATLLRVALQGGTSPDGKPGAREAFHVDPREKHLTELRITLRGNGGATTVDAYDAAGKEIDHWQVRAPR